MNREYLKVSNCIDSSTTQKHFESCDKLIELFEKKFSKSNLIDTEYLVGNLKESLNNKKLLIN